MTDARYIALPFISRYHCLDPTNRDISGLHCIHEYNTRIADHFHIPTVKTDLGKTGIKYCGAVIWNIIVKDGINTDVSETVFKKFLKKLVNDGIIP